MDIIELTSESTASELATAFRIRLAKNRAEIIERVKTEWLDHYHTDEIRYLLHALVEELETQETELHQAKEALEITEIRSTRAHNTEDEKWERIEGSVFEIRAAIARSTGDARVAQTTAEQKERAAKKAKLIRSRNFKARN